MKAKELDAAFGELSESGTPVKGALIRKGRRTILELLNKDPQRRTAPELIEYLQQNTCLSHAEIVASLRRMAKEADLKCEVDSETKKSLWCLSGKSTWHEATVIGKRSGQYCIENPWSGNEMCPLVGLEATPVLPGDRVLVSRSWSSSSYGYDLEESAQIEKLVKRGKTQWVCRLTDKKPLKIHGELFFLACPIDPFAPTAILVRDAPEASWKKAFVAELEEDLIRTPGGFLEICSHVLEVLGDIDDPNVEQEVAVRRFGLPHIFPENVIAEADAYPEKVLAKDRRGRVDLRDIAFVTIDGEDARDFDDAVWAMPFEEGWRLLVAIADVSHYVTVASALDREAQNRATSVYFPRCVIPMLPEKLSNGLCSLNPGVDRLTVVCDMVISARGEVSAYQFYPAVICSHARLTYTAVFAALQGDPKDLQERGGNLEDIDVLYKLYGAFRAARERRGAIDFDTAEAQILCDESGKITSITKREHNDAHRIIEECMLAANTCAADFITRKSLTSLFRVHDVPTADRLDTLRSELAFFGQKLEGGQKPTAADFERVLERIPAGPRREAVQLAMLRTMQQAVYSPTNLGHYGLNYSAYTHFTSPIRRYPDLLVHRTICAALKKKTYTPEILADTSWFEASRAAMHAKKSIDAIRLKSDSPDKPTRVLWERLGLICSAAERRADEASRDVVSWLKCVYAKSLPRVEYAATITAVNRAGLYVTLKDSFIEGFVHVSKIGYDYYYFDEYTQSFEGEDTGEKYALGETVWVRIDSVDIDSRNIDFSIVRRSEPRSNAKKKKKKR